MCHLHNIKISAMGYLYLYGLILIAVVFKIYLKLSIRYNDCYNCLLGRTAVITGANSGIGYITALDFAKRGCKVILACRNADKAKSAVYNIIKATGNTNVLFKKLDLSCFKSVREFACDINQSEERLDILVNNAGGVGFENKYTDDGLQIILQTNHVGPFLLTNLLLNKLKQSAPSRIINVSSIAGHVAGNMNLNDLNKAPKNVSIFDRAIVMYANTKLCNILFTIELAKRLNGTKVTANTLHPGIINTEFIENVPVFQNVVQLLGKLYFRTPVEGAQTTIYTALSNDLEGVTGKLFENCRQIKMYSNATNTAMATKLWELTEKWCKLEEYEKITH